MPDNPVMAARFACLTTRENNRQARTALGRPEPGGSGAGYTRMILPGAPSASVSDQVTAVLVMNHGPS
jgi:hypothetical protein